MDNLDNLHGKQFVKLLSLAVLLVFPHHARICSHSFYLMDTGGTAKFRQFQSVPEKAVFCSRLNFYLTFYLGKRDIYVLKNFW